MMDPPDLSYFPGSPSLHTHISQSLLPHHRGEQMKRGTSVYHQSNSKNTEENSVCAGEKREVGGLRWSTQHHAGFVPLGSWPCISPGVYHQSILTLSIHLRLDRCLDLWLSAQCCGAQAGASLCAAWHARLQGQEAL